MNGNKDNYQVVVKGNQRWVGLQRVGHRSSAEAAEVGGQLQELQQNT